MRFVSLEFSEPRGHGTESSRLQRLEDFDDIYEAFLGLHERVRAEGTTVLETHP